MNLAVSFQQPSKWFPGLLKHEILVKINESRVKRGLPKLAADDEKQQQQLGLAELKIKHKGDDMMLILHPDTHKKEKALRIKMRSLQKAAADKQSEHDYVLKLPCATPKTRMDRSTQYFPRDIS